MSSARTAAAAPLIITLNVGSSNTKLAAFDVGADGMHERWRTQVAISAAAAAAPAAERADAGDHQRAAQVMAVAVQRLDPHAPAVVVHRIVHGGEHFVAPTPIDAAALSALQALAALAPLHQPPALALVQAAQARWPGALQLGCFDTAFHHPLPALARRLPIPAALEACGVRRYGFHGLSYAAVVQHLRVHAPDLAERRLVIAHLGSGASLCAVHAGQSVDTTMGYTPLDGIPMATRPGALDPGVVLQMMRTLDGDPQRLQHMLYRACGLQALGGGSGDLQVLAAAGDQQAHFAVDYFARHAAKAVASLCVSLGGIEALVFTGGVGLHNAVVRARVVAHLAWLGLSVDAAANATNAAVISGAAADVPILIVATDEERMLAEAGRRYAAPLQCPPSG